MQKFDTAAPIAAVLDIPAGRVQFIASDRADTVVQVQPADAGKGRDVKAAEQTEVDYADGVLRVRTPAEGNQYFGRSGAVAITVELPSGSRLEAKAQAAEFRGAGRFGDVAIEGGYRQTKVDEAASVRITAVEGDVEVGHVGGSAEISTTKGDIRVIEAVRGTVVLRTEAGGITVNAAAGVSATLDAGTSYGRVSNALKNSEGAAAQLDIHATTSYGDIVARSH
ncbi:hypothetical protein ALI144C_06095 [Actinosynnema sp. ALI-1.44]|uniref:DUF4097 family beta strand repeat-containing protein n=1 Tax=Actinosynnema sp. ALI-1.44 TaxID=1933779 RepID=UPI00097C8561|nr:DUF4097 family beta strand repeat-containing protein [Actinosynnema sp. ALI-1.44]ONI88604.1 hypothetical protein ALI144C_06095 [Actinosynnema sp. ALI-1.44]